MKPTLLVLAAGMGSRYGGVKQIAAVGRHDETLLDYAVYDAMNNGFGKVVFIIIAIVFSLYNFIKKHFSIFLIIMSTVGENLSMSFIYFDNVI